MNDTVVLKRGHRPVAYEKKNRWVSRFSLQPVLMPKINAFKGHRVA